MSTSLFARVPDELARQVDAISERRRNTLQPASRSDLIREALVDLCRREAGTRRLVTVNRSAAKP